MTDEQKTLVRNSYAKISPDAPAVAALFYRRLFELDPNLRRLFKADMAEQGRKLMAMIGTAVANLDQIETIVPAVSQLGERHAGYGVKDADYETVGTALLWTLEQGLGEAFDPPAREAWTVCYGTLAGVMKNAAAAAS
ncbi:globin family protein [Rhodopila sp.]|uniref:globin family protein n=1 Tax=Rhodopila sp. TaxID=2480087 RepID=UPI003D0EA7BA